MLATNVQRSTVLEPPAKPGLYMLVPSLPPSSWLSSSDDQSDLGFAINARSLLGRLHRIFTERRFQGILVESGKARHLGLHLDLSGSSSDDAFQGPASPAEIGQMYELVRRLSPVLPPLYVGVAERQTIAERVVQHRRDIESADESNVFGARARALGIAWCDIGVLWVAAQTEAELAVLRAVERFLHILHRPPLSER